MGWKAAVVVVRIIRVVLTWPSDSRTYPRRRPIGLATTCIRGGNHRHTSHTNVRHVGRRWGEWGVETEETWIQNINMPCLFVWLTFVYTIRVIQQNIFNL